MPVNTIRPYVVRLVSDFIEKLPGSITCDYRFAVTSGGNVKMYLFGHRESEHCVFFGDYIMANVHSFTRFREDYFGFVPGVEALYDLMIHHKLIGE